MQNKLGIVFASFVLLLATGCANEKAEPAPEDFSSVEETAGEDDVIQMNGTTFNKREMEFYTLMQKIFIERNRAEDLQETPQDEKEINDYWNQQQAQYDNVNVQLQTLIEMHSMAVLAEEKNYFVPPELVEEKVAKVKQLFEDHEAIHDLVEQYGRDDFGIEIFPYMKEYLLKQRILEELEKDIRSRQPDATETEITYETDKMYEDLYEDQVSGMELEIYLK